MSDDSELVQRVAKAISGSGVTSSRSLRQARAAIAEMPLADWLDIFQKVDCLLTGYSTSGEGPEQPGDRIIVLAKIRTASAVIAALLK